MTTQALLDQHTKGISLYAYSMLHFAFNCSREDVEGIDRFTGYTILEGFKNAYNQTLKVTPQLDEKPLTLPKVLAIVDASFAEKLYGPISHIFPELVDDEMQSQGLFLVLRIYIMF